MKRLFVLFLVVALLATTGCAGMSARQRAGMEACRPDSPIRVGGEAGGCPQFNDKALIGSVRSITIGMLSCGEARSCWVPNGEMSFRSALTQKS